MKKPDIQLPGQKVKIRFAANFPWRHSPYKPSSLTWDQFNPEQGLECLPSLADKVETLTNLKHKESMWRPTDKQTLRVICGFPSENIIYLGEELRKLNIIL